MIKAFDLNLYQAIAVVNILMYAKNESSIKSLSECIEVIQNEIFLEENGCETLKKPIQTIINSDLINNPFHYEGKGMTVIDVILHYKMNFQIGNAFKYVVRCEKKGKKIEDLNKAIRNIEFEISTLT